MSEAYVGEIRFVAFPFAPVGWMLCNGQILPISQYQALFAVMGTTYGGDGIQTFALPNLQGCVPMHFGNGVVLGQTGGEYTHALTVSETPTHSHNVSAAATGNNTAAIGNFAGGVNGYQIYAAAPDAGVAMSPVGLTGGGVGHENEQPYLAIYAIVAYNGIFPSRA